MKMITGVSPVNIAVIKYWGKRDEKLILPLNDSISGTLSTNEMHAKTTVAMSPEFVEDKLWLNGKEVNVHHPRLAACFKELRKLAQEENLSNESISWKMHICSENNFPTAAGLASSAAGYSALVFTIAKLLGIEKNVSYIARQGSGSACRSMLGGFVRWHMGEKEDGTDSRAEQIIPESYWSNMRVFILVVNDQQKSIPSTEGMQKTVENSSLYQHRIKYIVPERCELMEKALRDKDFSTFSELTMKDSNQFHATCLDTYPPIVYMTQTSHYISHFVHEFNNHFPDRNRVAYTYDAGPNACLYLLEEDAPLVLSSLQYYFPPISGKGSTYVRGIQYAETPSPLQLPSISIQPPGELQYIISTKIGSGPKLLEDIPTNHLLNEQGLPKNLSS